MLSEPTVKIGKATACEIFLQPVTDIVKAHGNHNGEHQCWDQTQIGAFVHHVPVDASKWCRTKNRGGKPPNMDGENNGKPY